MRHCGVVVKTFVAGADVPGWTPGDTFFSCFCVLFFLFFFFFFFFFNTVFPFGLFSFILSTDHADHALGSIYILSLTSGVLFLKRDFKSS